MSKPETIRTAKLGKTALDLVRKDGRFFGLANRSVVVEGEDADDVWRRLHDEAGKGDAKYFGFEGARIRFAKFFPNGFHTAGYEGEERTYKLKAKEKLDETVPLEAAASGSGFGDRVRAVFASTNLLSRFEKTDLQDVLTGADADPFIRAAARFTLGDHASALREMDKVLRPHDAAKWTIVTYLPFLWRPDAHMFLKPEVTKDFAARVGHPFAARYEAPLNMAVYESLLDLVTKTEVELAPLEPRDRIDVQSFIYVVGDYKEGRDEAKA